MEKINLNAIIRSTEEKLSEVRTSKMIPAVVYGKHQEPIHLKMNYSEFLKTFRKSGESLIINLKADKNELEVIVHEIQREPISGDFIHIDFYAITRGEKVTTKIALKFIWESQAVKEWAILDEHMKEIEVKVLPKNLVESFEVDLSILEEMGDSIKLSELKIDSEKFDILTADDVVVSATKPAKVEEISDEAPEAAVTGADEVEEESTEETK